MKLITALRKSAALVIAMVFMTPLLLTGCNSSDGVGGGSSITGTTLSSIAVTPATLTVAKGQAEKLTATATYSDGATADITSQVSWVSAAPSIATIDSSTGVATGVAVGSTTVSASSGGITSPGANLTVTPAVLTEISIAPTAQTAPKGTDVSYTATGVYSDGSSADVSGSVTWASADTGVATISDSGVASALAQGSTTITASANGITSNNAALNVRTLAKIAINPSTASVAKGLSSNFTATGTYTDDTTGNVTSQLNWTTGNAAVATIDSSTGIATGVSVGTTTVTASADGITSNGANLSVTTAVLTGISISPSVQATPKGTPVTFTATGSYTDGSFANVSGSVIWASTNTSVATINGSGIASSLAQGKTTITASAGGLTSNSAALSVTAPALTAISINPTTASVAKGLSSNFTATGTYTDASTANITSQVTWAAGNTAVATIDSNTGIATAEKVGSTTITASVGSITAPGASLTVTAAVLNGISITPAAQSTPKGTPVTFTAAGTYSDGSTANVSGSVIWTSTKTSVATINGSGSASSLTQGKTTITASAGGLTSNSATLSVTAPALTAISINPSTASVAKGLSSNFTATGTYTDASTANITSQVTWATGNAAVATIDSSTGIATGVTVGSTKVTASANGVASPGASLSVTAAVLNGVSITPAAQSTPKGTPVTFTAAGTYSDGSTANVSGSVIWTSTNTSVATINASGIASSLAQGSTTITASADGLTSNSAALTVTTPELMMLSITPESASVTLGDTQQYSASGTLTDGTTATPGTLIWTSSNVTATSINSTGLATTHLSGSSNISASLGGITSNSAVLLTAPLAAPESVVAVSASGQVTLSWSAVTDAASYNIYWGTAPGITKASSKITGATSPYVHSPLLDGNTYYYRVGAANAAVVVLSAETYSFLYSGGNPAGTFMPAADRLINARVRHNATLLANGNVLVTAGWNGTIYLANSELYDSTTGTFSATGSLQTQRAYSTATLLPNGSGLVIGGHNLTGSLPSAELYDPVTGKFTATGSMKSARENHTATLLFNGKVLVSGGWDGAADLATAELYDPATGTFSATGSMTTARAKHVATLLTNGKVLVTGGCSTINCVAGELATTEIYDPVTGTFTAAGNLSYARHSHTATLLPSGKVIIIGGDNFDGVWPGRSETYNPADGTFSPTAILVNAGSYHSAFLLSNGKVIVMPCGCGDAPTGAHIYDPATDSFSLTGTSKGLKYQNSVLLPNGRILLTGGQSTDSSNVTTIYPNAEFFQ